MLFSAFRLAEVRAVALLAAVIAAAAWKEPRLLEETSISAIFLGVPLIAIMAIGQMGVIVTRGIDVSVGSTLGFSGIAVGMLLKSYPDLNVLVAAGLGLVIGALLGLVNGSLVAWLRVPPIIATLGALSAYRSATFILSRGEQIDSNDIPVALTHWSLDGPFSIFGVTLPWLLLVTLALAVI